MSYCEMALALLEKLGDRLGQAGAWDSLGYAHHHLGQHGRALSAYQHALGLCRDLGDRYHEAEVLTHMGDAHHAGGDSEAARAAWQHALDILTELGHRAAGGVRAKLRATAK